MRRLCGWESQSDIPSDSTMSQAFGDFAEDGTVRVRGHAKVLLHLTLGLLVIAVEQSAKMLC
mgnify:CR=1 FL=1